MNLDAYLIALLLVAAFFHASWNAVVKSSSDRFFAASTVVGMGTFVFCPALFFVDFPPLEIWPYLSLSVLLHVGYYLFLTYAYRQGDLSVIYPIARGFSPLMITVGAAFLADQILTPIATVGVIAVSFGICLFAFEKGIPFQHLIKSILMALVVSCFIAFYTVVDGLALLRLESPYGYIAWLLFLDGIPFLVWTLLRHGNAYRTYISLNGRGSIIGGILAMFAYALVLYALSIGEMAYISALRETSVLFAVVLGAVALGEKFGLIRWIAVVTIVCGVFSMQLF